MKIHALLTRFGSRAVGVLCGGIFTGVLTGLVIAMIAIHQVKPAYRASTRIAVEPPDKGGSAESKRAWLDELAATLRSREALTQAATRAEMDQLLGLSKEECAAKLESTVAVRVADDDRRTLSDHSFTNEPGFIPRQVIFLSNEGPDATVCARVLDELARVLEHKVSALNQQLAEAHPARQQWLAITSQVPPLLKEITEHEKVLLNAHAGTSGRHLNSAELLASAPPQIARETHSALKAAVEKVARLREEASGIEPREGWYFHADSTRVPADATGPNWEPYAWQRALWGAVAGLLAALALLIPRNGGSEDNAPAFPAIKPVEY